MKTLIAALALRRKYNTMDLSDCVKEFEQFTNQVVPAEAIRKFEMSGLDNIDFLTSDFLNGYGLKNMLQFNGKNI